MSSKLRGADGSHRLGGEERGAQGQMHGGVPTQGLVGEWGKHRRPGKAPLGAMPAALEWSLAPAAEALLSIASNFARA